MGSLPGLVISKRCHLDVSYLLFVCCLSHVYKEVGIAALLDFRSYILPCVDLLEVLFYSRL